MNKLITLSLGLMLASNVWAQNCNSNVDQTTPSVDFDVNGDGTVTHLRTGLIWMRCSIGLSWDGTTCSGTATQHTWKEALEQAESTTYAGQDDWRLPNVKEFASIIEQSCWNPPINEDLFPATPGDFYWTSTPCPNDQNGGCVWQYFLPSGLSDANKTNPNYVRLVRDQ